MDAYNAARREKHRERHRVTYAKNREARKAQAKAYYAANKDKINKKLRFLRKASPEKYRKQATEWQIKNPQKVMWRSAKQRAAKMRLAFTILPDDIKIPQHCPVLGTAFTRGKYCGGTFSPTLDRIKGERGYIKDNIRVISWRANRLKSDGTIQEFEAILQYMKDLKNGE